MKIKQLSLCLTLLTLVGCNYRVFDLAEYPEIQGVIPEVSAGENLTEENFNSIYETIIKPQCLSCHRADGDASLVPLDTYADLTSSAFGEPLIIPGNPEESVFYKVLLPTAGRKMMPPTRSGRPPVEPARVEIIRLWIANGAPESAS